MLGGWVSCAVRFVVGGRGHILGLVMSDHSGGRGGGDGFTWDCCGCVKWDEQQIQGCSKPFYVEMKD